MTCADSTERAAPISGLRGLADLESSPEVPAPSYPTVLTFPPDGDWMVMRAGIDAIAARLGVIARETAGGHYVAARSFGPVEYRAVAIPPRSDGGNEESG
jgi:hypothetical protein